MARSGFHNKSSFTLGNDRKSHPIITFRSVSFTTYMTDLAGELSPWWAKRGITEKGPTWNVWSGSTMLNINSLLFILEDSCGYLLRIWSRHCEVQYIFNFFDLEVLSAKIGSSII